jgi:hypothetical protein
MSKTRDNSRAATTFIARKSEIDAILARLVRLSTVHFNRAPADVIWTDVGTMGSYVEVPRRVSNAAFHEGEHAT